jgi:hypothetical protein
MSAILEVIIGIAFVFALLSILVSQINNMIVALLNLRTRHLRGGLAGLVSDEELLAKIMTHPLVRMVEHRLILPDQRLSDEQTAAILAGKLSRVPWIETATFVNVLLNVLSVESDRELFGTLLNVVDGMPSGQDRRTLRVLINRVIRTGEGLQELRAAIAAMESRVYREALQESLDQIDDLVGQIGLDTENIVSILAGVRRVKDPYFRAALNTILATARTLKEAETQLSSWFNEGMGRATAAFTRHMGWFSLGIGLLLAVLINADALHMAETLWNDPVIRTTAVVAATEAVQNPNAGVVTPVQPNADLSVEDGLDAVEEAYLGATATVNDILSLRLPLGWYFTNVDMRTDLTPAQVAFWKGDSRNLWNYLPGAGNPDWAMMMFTKLLGLAMTAIAVAQGAPFWFNLIRRITTGGTAATSSG